ncbi:hypothetical protein VC83_08173 [Pseudogymnoascus destructans]|uniref:Uncharacterized protein n=1 Tax=Pseudogymnoascus destructans TaxID=655981 RepID=A0A176ZZ81_9PEZI|nr:uncharacterized protein VC83_08173 [Pseudogymnoascus destructans]OAF55226.1 hypothetical protein VC83_08173 [Pseudogymnoascus destructans]
MEGNGGASAVAGSTMRKSSLDERAPACPPWSTPRRPTMNPPIHDKPARGEHTNTPPPPYGPSSALVQTRGLKLFMRSIADLRANTGIQKFDDSAAS